MHVFTIVDCPKYNKEYGRYKSKSPLSAAKKVYTDLEKKFKLDTNTGSKTKYLEFTIRNIRTNKFYTYMGANVKLNSPITVTRGGKTMVLANKHLVFAKPSKLNVNTLDTIGMKYTNQYNKLNQNSHT
jgi:hypothetical protein